MAVPQRSNFTNLQQLVNANQGNQLGNTIQNGVQKGITGLKSNVNKAEEQFQGDVNNNKLDTEQNQDFTKNTISNIINPAGQSTPTQTASSGNPEDTSTMNQSAPPQTQPAPQVELQPTPTTAGPSKLENATNVSDSSSPTPTASNASSSAPAAANSTPGSFGAPTSQPNSGANTTPSTYTPQASAISQFSKLLQGNYGGPSQLNDYNTLLAQGQNLQGLGQNINTQGGLQSLLQQYIGGNNYTQGQQGLDTLLLGQTGKPQLQNTARMLQNVIKIPQSAQSQAQGLAQQTATGNQQFANNLRNQLTAAENPILQNIQNQIDTANQTNQGIQTSANSINDLLNNPTQSLNSNTNRIGGHAAAPTTDLQSSQKAIQDAFQNKMIDAGTFNKLNQLIGTMSITGGNPKEALAHAFNNAPVAMPQYSLQQGANAQQAAQLNALQQLSGQSPEYTKYGGITPISAGFALNQLPQLEQYQSKLLQNPTLHRDGPAMGGFQVNPEIYAYEYAQKLAAYNAQQKALQNSMLANQAES